MMAGKKAARRRPFFRGDSGVNLLKAAGDWVRAHGGDVIVAGGIQVQRWPEDPEFTFRIAVRCTGKQPVPSATDPEESASEKTERRSKHR
jgi:hypothetical protein